LIVVDSSAACAILFGEAETPVFEEIIARDSALLPVSALVESAIAWRRRGGQAAIFDRFLAAFAFEILPSDERQARIAAEADRRFGRGTGHPARLNFGDCLAYAAAVAHDAPLLFKGDDFARTDVRRAV
jgi:ribonuclease VapC